MCRHQTLTGLHSGSVAISGAYLRIQTASDLSIIASHLDISTPVPPSLDYQSATTDCSRFNRVILKMHLAFWSFYLLIYPEDNPVIREIMKLSWFPISLFPSLDMPFKQTSGYDNDEKYAVLEQIFTGFRIHFGNAGYPRRLTDARISVVDPEGADQPDVRCEVCTDHDDHGDGMVLTIRISWISYWSFMTK